MLIDRLNWRYATKKMNPDKVVPEEKLARILEATRLAPTSSGLQQYEVIVVTNKAIREKIRRSAGTRRRSPTRRTCWCSRRGTITPPSGSTSCSTW